MIFIYTWLRNVLQTECELTKTLKESERGSVFLIRHKATDQKLILRHYTGNAEVYRKLLGYSCSNLPRTLEVASRGEENLVLEEYIQGDTLDFLMKDALFSQEETRKIVRQLCQALWVLHSMGAVHRDIKPENVILRGADAVLIDFDARGSISRSWRTTPRFWAPPVLPLRSSTACPRQISGPIFTLWGS